MSEVIKQERSIETVTTEIIIIRDRTAKMLFDAVVEIGTRLCEAKEMVAQGEWTNYLENRLGFKPSTAQYYMKIARELGSGQVGLDGKTAEELFSGLSYSQILPLLGLPENVRQEIAEENDLHNMSSREIAALVKEKKEAEQRADQAEQEAQRERKKRENADAIAIEQANKAKEAQEKILKLESNAKDIKSVKAKLSAAEGKALELGRRIEELENAPIEASYTEIGEEKLDDLREEIRKEEHLAVLEALERAEKYKERYEAAKNPQATQVSFLFTELQQTFGRMQTALVLLEESQPETAKKMQDKISEALSGMAQSL